MRYSVLLDPVTEPGFEGYYYARIPALDLTTHGEGVEGALAAARDLAELWISEKLEHGGTVPDDAATLLTQIEVADPRAVLSA
jgi:predicted RNase H-like HicB family nuclease